MVALPHALNCACGASLRRRRHEAQSGRRTSRLALPPLLPRHLLLVLLLLPHRLAWLLLARVGRRGVAGFCVRHGGPPIRLSVARIDMDSAATAVPDRIENRLGNGRCASARRRSPTAVAAKRFCPRKWKWGAGCSNICRKSLPRFSRGRMQGKTPSAER